MALRAVWLSGKTLALQPRGLGFESLSGLSRGSISLAFNIDLDVSRSATSNHRSKKMVPGHIGQ